MDCLGFKRIMKKLVNNKTATGTLGLKIISGHSLKGLKCYRPASPSISNVASHTYPTAMGCLVCSIPSYHSSNTVCLFKAPLRCYLLHFLPCPTLNLAGLVLILFSYFVWLKTRAERKDLAHPADSSLILDSNSCNHALTVYVRFF